MHIYTESVKHLTESTLRKHIKEYKQKFTDGTECCQHDARILEALLDALSDVEYMKCRFKP